MAGPGKLYFAWISDPASEPFDAATHAREDENVYRAKISQAEGEFRTARLLIDSPGTGLLNTGTPWAHLSIEDESGTVRYLGTGRLSGFPIGLSASDATTGIELVFRPADWESQQDSLIQSLKVAPYFLDEFVPEDLRDAPEEVLAARSAMLCWDPFTNSVKASDVLEGSRLVTINSDRIFEDTLTIDLSGPPVSQIDVEIEAQWTQTCKTYVDVAEDIVPIGTLTPTAIESGWRQMIDSGSGYRLYDDRRFHEVFLTGTTDHTFEVDVTQYPSGDPTIDAGFLRDMTFREYVLDGQAYIIADYAQKRVETLKFTLQSALQPISNTGGNAERERIRLESIDEKLDSTHTKSFATWSSTDTVTLWEITTPYRPAATYFGDGVGKEAIEHALLRARARLAFASRAVEISCSVPIEDALDLTLDDSVRLVSSRIPGGSARGKLIDVKLEIDGVTGDQFATITIGCCAGTGSATYGTTGPDVLVETYANEFGGGSVESRVRADVIDGTPSEPIDVDTMVLDAEAYTILGTTVSNGAADQIAAIQAELDNGGDPEAKLAEIPTSVEIDLRDLTPVDELRHTVEAVPDKLGLPAHVNLGGL